MSDSAALRVSEIYASIQGESTYAGLPCVFVRLTGCPLRCVWCDTTYAFTGGERRPLEEIVSTALAYGIDVVEVTGGEPLAQRETPLLLIALAERFSTVLLETSGAFPIADLDPRVRVIMDLKAPGSGEEHRNLWENIGALSPGDELKIVIAGREDYEWSRRVIRETDIPAGVPVHLSPVHGDLAPHFVAEWIVEDRLPARLMLQQHKYVWGPDARGV